MTERLTGLLPPPPNWAGSKCPPLLGAGSSVTLLTWSRIKEIAASGKLDGSRRYGTRFHVVQQHNNCTSAAAASVVAKSIYDARGAVLRLSDTYLYSLINGGRDAGAMLSDAMEAIEVNGVCLAETCGPHAIYRRNYDTRTADEQAERFRATECYAIRPRDFDNNDECRRAFWSALCLGFKVGVAVQAGNRFDTVDSIGIAGVDSGSGNHAIHADGIALLGDEIVATCENSWPLSLATGGRLNATWAHFSQTIGVHEFYAARGVRGDTAKPIEVRDQ